MLSVSIPKELVPPVSVVVVIKELSVAVEEANPQDSVVCSPPPWDVIANPQPYSAATDTLGGIYNYYPGYESNAVPFIGKINGGTDNVLVIADGIGNLMYYDGLDNNLMGTYTRTDSMRVSKSMIGVTGANLNGNDSLELIVGERTGGLMYLDMDEDRYSYSPYPRDTCVISSIYEMKGSQGDSENLLDIYPNPNNGSFKIKLDVQNPGTGYLSILDMAGKTIIQHTYMFNKAANEIEVSGIQIPAGVYIVQIRVNDQILRQKLVIQ